MENVLKEVQEKKGMTLRQLSKASGISYPVLRHYEEYEESDPLGNIRWEHALSLAEVLPVSVNDLLDPYGERTNKG